MTLFDREHFSILNEVTGHKAVQVKISGNSISMIVYAVPHRFFGACSSLTPKEFEAQSKGLAKKQNNLS